jgi:peroxiredoxin
VNGESPRRVRYSTNLQGDYSAVGHGAAPTADRRSGRSVNQWTALAALTVVGCTAFALAMGVLLGRGLRTAQPPKTVTVRATLAPQSVSRVPALRINLRPSADSSAANGSTAGGAKSALDVEPLGPGQAAPDFQLPTVTDDDLALSDLAGRTVIINFWATWCTWCRYEMPALEAVHRKYRQDGLTVVGVDVAETRPLVEAFADRYNVSFPIVLDIDGGIAETYQVRGLPMTYFVSGDGDIVRVQRGAMREDELELYVREALAGR